MKAVTPFLAIALLLAGLAGNAEAQRKAKPRDAMKLSPPVKVGRADIGGVVSGEKGPEAGVWVIAETADLPTQYAKVVVTDDKGRYMIPGLPKAKYSLWVRGYGLVDSAKVPATPGKIVYLTAVAAPSPKEAAQYYGAQYCFSLLGVPESSEFPPGRVASQGQWLNTIKTGACQSCHALGTPGMRTVPRIFMEKGDSVEAWRERLKSGGAMALMARDIGRLDGERAIRLFAEWTDRIAAGELPFAQPERPKGVERNVVLTLSDWSQPTAYLHDAVSTDRRNPRVNAGGKVYGSPEDSTDYVPVLDPGRNSADEVFHPVRDPDTPSSKDNPFGPSAGWGPKPIWDNRTLNHNPMSEAKAQGWTALVLDTNGNGKRDDYVEPDQPVDPAKDKRVVYALYAVAVSPADGTIWGTATGYPGAVLRVVPGADPASTALTEVYEPPAPIAFGPRGGDVDANGVYWVSLASGHLGSFDRPKWRVLK